MRVNVGLLVVNLLVALLLAVFIYRKRRSPAWMLFILAPMLGELLSSSSPPVEFLSPFVIVLALMYGGGALLIREMLARWGKGWPSLLALGVAYAIAEEGLACKSFFDPNWMDLGAAKDYGRWLGINSVWTVGLTFYHMLFSIAAPILLVYILFPERRSTPWLSSRRFTDLAVLFCLDIVTCFFLMPSGPGGTQYYPPAAWVLISLAAIAGLALVARRLPRHLRAGDAAPGRRVARPFWFGCLGLTGAIAYMVTGFVLPSARVDPAVTLIVMAMVMTAYCASVVRISGETVWDDRHRLALIAGAFALPIAVSFLREFGANQPDNPAGQSLVGIAATAFLVWLWRRVSRRASEAHTDAAPVVQDSAAPQ